MNRYLQQFVGILFILTAGAWAYHNSFTGAFVFDDISRIQNNFHIRHLWPIWDVFKSTSRPLIELSLALNYAFGGTNVFGYHLVNLLIHLCAALVLFGTVRRTFLTESLRDRYGDASHGLALAIALLWVVHPLQTESVTYIIQRAESMMGLFYLLTLYCFIRGVASEKQRTWYVLAGIACASGMMSKPIMVTAPLMVLLYDRTFISGTLKQSLIQRKGLYAGLAATWGLLAIFLAISPPDPAAGFEIPISPLTYARTQPGVLLHYLKLSLWPTKLVLDYAWPVAQSAKEILVPLLIIGLLIFLTIWGGWKKRPIGFLGIWFFLTLIPTSSFIPIQDFAVEHRMYLPLAAMIGLVVLGGYALLQRVLASQQKFRWVSVIGLIAIVAIPSGLTTIHRNNDYSSDENIWRDTISKSPRNARAYDNLGVDLYRQGDLEEAKAYFLKALQLDPTDAEIYNHLGSLLIKQGHLEEAITYFVHILKQRPDYADAYNNLGFALYHQGHSEEAVKHFTQALQLKPNFADAHNNLGMVLDDQRHIEEAKSHYLQAIQLNPDLSEAHSNLGIVLYKQGHLEEARDQFTQALQLDPLNAVSHYNLGLLYKNTGKQKEAVNHFTEALRLKPDFASAKEDLKRLMNR